MTSLQSSKTESLRLHIGRVKEEIPSVGDLLEAFQDLLLQETGFKETLNPPTIEIGRRDLKQDLRAGIPLGSCAEIRIPREELNRAAEALLPSLRTGFPSIASQLDGIASRLKRSGQILASAAEAFLAGNHDDLRRHRETLGVERDVLLFVLTSLIEPFAETWDEKAGPIIRDLEWLKGYCPLCASWPNISFWRGDGGKRWLHCSFCGHEWTFMRTVCPFCDNDDQQKLESIFSDDRPFKAADACLACTRYLLRKYLREEVREVFPEVAALGMAHLDALAQDRGFRPPLPDERPPSQEN